MSTATPSLTSLAAGAGCGCKLGAQEVLPIVRDLARDDHDPRLLVGSATSDDAAVFRLRDDLAIVQTIDFFTPLVDDPYDFGRIAAANALSDVYAMGGTPVTAMNVVAFPLELLGGEVLHDILRGGQDVVVAAGASIVGGHSIRDDEPKYGLAVTGTIDPRRLLSNAGAQEGDAIVLTKPLGVGAVVTARKRGGADDALLARAVEVMTTLNARAAEQALAAGTHALTDVTGYGLLGHLHHLARESGLAAELDASAVPALAGVQELLDDPAADVGYGGAKRNAEWAEGFATIADDVPAWTTRLLFDAQTSGGLLAAVPAARAGEIDGWVVGRFVAGEAGAVAVA